MSGSNKAAIKGYYRRKVTLACESCRKRRVKCSGSQPCSLCIDSGTKCTYDSSNRSRRGPRPRQPPSAPENVPRLAPRPGPGLSITIETTPSLPLTDALLQGLQGHGFGGLDDGGGGGEPAATATVDYPVVQVPDLDHDDAENTDSDASENGSLGVCKNWETDIGGLIFATNSAQTQSVVEQQRRLKVICHLIEAFHARGIKQLRELLSPASFLLQLTRGLLSDGLIFGICAYSHRLSVHDSLRRHDGVQTASQFAQAARERLITAGTDWKQINDIRSICILVEYETACGNGRRAWTDIAMGRSLLELAYSTNHILPEQREILDMAYEYLMQAHALHSLGRPQLQSEPFRSRYISPTDYGNMISSETAQQHLHLLNIHRKIEMLYSKPPRQDEPSHWGRDSRFRTLQSELEKQLIQANISSNEVQSPEAAELKAHQGSADFIQLSLIWHLCAIALNRIFLPIPFQSQLGVESRHSVIIFQQYPNAPSLFLNENVSRCDASADAICLLVRQIVNHASFFHNPLLLGYACMNSALVLSNRLHRESEMRRETTMKHIRIAFAVLKAVGLCYQPAQYWLHVARESYLINDRLIYATGPTSLLFETFFNRFEALEEAPMVPLDAAISDYGPLDRRVNDEAEEIGRNTSQGDSQSHQAIQNEEKVDSTPAWQQLYTSHLSEVVDHNHQPVGKNLSFPGRHVVSGVCEATPCEALLAGDELPPADTSIQSMMNIGDGPDMVDIHEAGAILASLSGFDLSAMPNAHSGGWETGGGSFDELMTFLQMPSLMDIEDINLDMTQFI